MYDCNCCNCIKVPETELNLTSGCRVKLGRFSTTIWILSYGWYTWGGNRPFCGWYLTDLEDPTKVKPLQEPDLHDICVIEL